MRKILCIVGESGAGKDTLAESIISTDSSNTRYKLYKFAAPGKRLFERIYGLKTGFMDDRVARVAICPGGETTYLQRFIFWFHNQQNIFPPGLFLKIAIREILRDLRSVDVAVYTDLRTPQEAKMLTKLVAKYQIELVPIVVVSPGAEAESSDMYLDLNLAILAKTPIIVINDKNVPIQYITNQIIKSLQC
jgi:hypothetical protein